MHESTPEKIERGARRGTAAVLGLITGTIVGFFAGFAFFGFGDLLLVTTGTCAVACAVLCFQWPTTILSVARIALSVFGNAV